MFASAAVAFSMIIAAGALVDRIVSRRWPVLLWQNRNLELVELFCIRLGVGAYAFCLWNKDAVAPWGASGSGTILTPELFEHDHWLRLIQLAVGLMLLLRRTCPVAAFGLGTLYAIGIARYGLFHMMDYIFFLGLSGYLVLSSPYFDRRPSLLRWRIRLITGGLAFSLMWTAIEKFLYPDWTSIVLLLHPDLTLGFPIPFVTVTAGFVEFSVAFYLLVGRSLLRFDAVIIMTIFLAAIPEFGVLDSVGHLPIVAILLVIAIHGTTDPQKAILPPDAGFSRAVASVTGRYIVSFVTMMAMYYGLQKTGARP